MLLGVFFLPTMISTETVSLRIGGTTCRLIAGFEATMGPRVIGLCTVGSCRNSGGLLLRSAGCSCCLVLFVDLPVCFLTSPLLCV